MKGVILAGGLGTRLYPLTKITNKHLLPVYDRPMIYYPIEALVNAGIEDIMIVTGGRKSGDFLSLLGNGSEFGLKHLNYTYQEGEGGIAEALGLCEHWAQGESICVILGDNIIQYNVAKAVADFRAQGRGAKIMLKQVHDPQRFGVAELDGERVVSIVEKPKEPKSDLAVIGIYLYDGRVFDVIKQQKPSDRGELEITDVNNWYIADGSMTYEVLPGWWTDAGTFESLHRASQLVAEGRGEPDGRAPGNAAVTAERLTGRVLLTGAAGMLGSQLLRDAPAGAELVTTDLARAPGLDEPGLDLAEPEACERLFRERGPFAGVIHAAAWTAVDEAEQDEAGARRANADAVRNLARAACEGGARLVAVGTDFVFDGEASEPYPVDAAPRPLSAYGRTKLAGERAALDLHPGGAAVVRTQWLYGPRGNHFPRTIARAARERGALKVVDDQVGAPTTTLELSPALWDVLASDATGVFHAACEESCSWFGFTAAILEELGLGEVGLEPCTTDQFPRPAARPAYSVLDCARLTVLRGRPMAGWREALRAYLAFEPI